MVARGADGAQLARRFDRTAFARRSDRHDHGGYGDVRGPWNAGCGVALQPAFRIAAGRCVSGAHLVGFIRFVVVIIVVVVVVAFVVIGSAVIVFVFVIVVVIVVIGVAVVVVVFVFFRRVVGNGDVLFVNLANAARDGRIDGASALGASQFSIAGRYRDAHGGGSRSSSSLSRRVSHRRSDAMPRLVGEQSLHFFDRRR